MKNYISKFTTIYYQSKYTLKPCSFTAGKVGFKYLQVIQKWVNFSFVIIDIKKPWIANIWPLKQPSILLQFGVGMSFWIFNLYIGMLLDRKKKSHLDLHSFHCQMKWGQKNRRLPLNSKQMQLSVFEVNAALRVSEYIRMTDWT